ncbi:M1 family metallopeptidase [Mucilaginibacter sp. JRF]|uniref:M1 family metallopeptidase n=1 Tax=Mucilaginibacter sp. JRF TaxID=2780088 RepID=UPI001880AD96|nr:M1 family metallopeptidase [Mucilaginibacter sp. JRF]MBE9582915.1 M1 family metallopeptidase [Mucilaginibacter sp. JRF]
MLKKLLITTLLGAAVYQTQAQSLYMPRDIKAAFAKQTRSPNGKPGKNYWQNRGRYNITVTVDPATRNVKGTEQITYINNSPDTLRLLNLKFILNTHRPGAARFSSTQQDYLTEGIQIDKMQVNGDTQKWNNEPSGTNRGLRLSKPLMPGDSLKLDIDWHFLASVQSGREGMLNPSTMFLAYFYPRVAVYDDYNGWDTLEFLDAQEFYNDFNDYTLNVKAPKNFIVWATGTLQNAKQVLQPEYYKRLQKSFTSDSTIHVATADDIAKKKVTAQNDLNTWTWTSTNISDVALAVSDNYVWDAASVIVDPKTKRRASMQAAFADSAADFHKVVQFGRHSLGWLSQNWPGVPYPFPKMTSVMGFADMEYPMMCNDSHTESFDFTQFVQDHEIAHTWMPFYMGINESRYAFMDEGWATTFELLIGTAEFGKQKAESLFKQFRVAGWINSKSTVQDLPIITPSSELRGGYGNNAYGKPALSHLALKDMLGDELFKKALHGYMDRWNGKHPIPWDYFNSMSNVSGQDLNWFFNNWYFTNYYIDLAVQGVNKADGGYSVAVQNVGGFVVPFDVKVTYADGSTESVHQTAAVWKADQKQTSIAIKTTKTIQSVTLDGGIFMDATVKDNTFKL